MRSSRANPQDYRIRDNRLTTGRKKPLRLDENAANSALQVGFGLPGDSDRAAIAPKG
jgi:hypothetical protein